MGHKRAFPSIFGEFSCISTLYSVRDNCINQLGDTIFEGVSLTVQMERFQCPYCDRQAASPGGVRFHVKLEHSDKLDEFNEMHYPGMAERFRKIEL
jgi:hypothetical protein